MNNKDREHLRIVTQDALAGAGGMLSVRTVFGMLQSLESRFGDNFTIDGACEALDQLIVIAELAKESLKEKST
jgi:hypothetical protein